MAKSLNFDLNLEYQDKGMTIILIVFTLMISVLSYQVYSQIRQATAEKFLDVEPMLRYYFISLFLALAAQTALVPATSTNLSPYPEKIGNEGWDSMLEIQLFCDLFISILLFSLPYVMYETDLAAAKCIKFVDVGNTPPSQPDSGSGSINESNTSLLQQVDLSAA